MPSYKHTDWINSVMSDEQYSEEYETAVQKMPNGALIPHPDKYKKKYDAIVFEVMQSSNSSMCHVCAALQCSQPTVRRWIQRHPSFREAYNNGRMIGEIAFRKKLEEHSERPAKDVNTGLLKLLANNIHGITDVSPQVVINNTVADTVVAGDEETASLYAEALEKGVDRTASVRTSWEEEEEGEGEEIDIDSILDDIM